MENLPREILTEIFNNLKTKDLLSLTLVCKNFNEIISNTKQLLEKFVLRFTAQAKNHKLEATRKYTKINMRYNYCQNLMQFVENQGQYLTSIRFMFIKMELWTLKALLNNCKNLKKLTFINFQIEISFKDICEPLPKLELDYLSFNCDRRLLRLFTKCNVKELTTYCIYSDDHELKLLQQFLKSQKQLEKLEFSNFAQDYQLFESNKLNEIEFKLKELHLHNFTQFSTINFEKFLKNHSETLEKVSLKQFKSPTRNQAGFQYEISELFREMKFLKNLDLRGFNISDIKTFHFVEKLELEEYSKIDSTIHRKFPNLKILTLYNPLSVHKEFLDSTISRMEKLIITCADNISWIVEVLKYKDIKLKHLKIENSYISENKRKLIEELCDKTKIQKLEIVESIKNNEDENNLKFNNGNNSSENSDGNEEEEEDEEIEEEEEEEESDEEMSDDTEDELEFILNDNYENEKQNLGNECKRPKFE